MYLHKDDKELLRDIIVTVSERTGIDESIVEKDYYVTMILKELVQRNPNVVFKGGTSLSKAYRAIDRFSEDIDITFEEHLGEARRKKIKYQLLQPISDYTGSTPPHATGGYTNRSLPQRSQCHRYPRRFDRRKPGQYSFFRDQLSDSSPHLSIGYRITGAGRSVEQQ